MPDYDRFCPVVATTGVRLAFAAAAHFELRALAADISSAYLHVDTKEKIYIVLGPEFKGLEGRKAIVKKAWYGQQTAGARFHECLSETFLRMGFTPSRADPDLYMREQDDHYEYIARYVDDLLVFSHNPEDIVKEVKKEFLIKDKNIGKPEYFLGGNVETLGEDLAVWKEHEVHYGLSAETYIENLVQRIERVMDRTLRVYRSPMSPDCHPEMDESPLLDDEGNSKYRMLVGSANWCVTLGRIDVQYAVCTLARQNGKAREGHIDAMMRVFGYLKWANKGRTLIDMRRMDMDNLGIEFPEIPLRKWKEFYPDAGEEIPENLPPAKGDPVQTIIMVDASFASDLDTRRSVSGAVTFCNSTPIRAYCKRQTTVEQSTYGSEMIACRNGVDMAIELRHDLRWIGLKIVEPTLLLSDNMSVVLNVTVPSSPITKKHVCVSYHRIRESVAGGFIKVGHIRSERNFADILTKPLVNLIFANLVRPLLFRNLDYTGTSKGAVPRIDIPTTDRGEITGNKNHLGDTIAKSEDYRRRKQGAISGTGIY